MAPAAEPRGRLGEPMPRQQAVIDRARELVAVEASFLHLSTSMAAGYEVAAARERFELARSALRGAVGELDR
jgi:hypothetical protein